MKKESGDITINGSIDVLDDEKISGWVCNVADLGKRLMVGCRTSSGNLLVTVADIYRKDLESEKIGDGRYGFTLTFPQEGPLRDERGLVTVEIVGTEQRLSKRFPDAKKSSAVTRGPREYSDLICGNIDFIDQGAIVGWMYSAVPAARPLIFVDGFAALLEAHKLERKDVSAELGVPDRTGFQFRSSRISVGARIELFAMVNGRLWFVTEKLSETSMLPTKFMDQITNAKLVSSQKDAVAITCWDGAHNPIGRAKVLYDIVVRNRPALIVTYLFEEFGGRIWPPILSTSCAVLSIPWRNRTVYENAIRAAGITFDAVWVCKPRYPGFLLARLIASSQARLVLDIDDNEEHFSKSHAARDKSFGRLTINLSRQLMSDIPVRTAPSITLKDEYDARLVRHARARCQISSKFYKREKNDISVGFVGTVRPHKRLLEAARAFRLLSWKAGKNIVLHIYGDVTPPKLVEDLKAYGAIVKIGVPMSQLYETISGFDLVLTGFPGEEFSDDAVTRYQISSKIGDALAVGRPVLVPRSESVADLEGTAGVFLFDESDLSEQLMAALDYDMPVALPQDFTLEGAYKSFSDALDAASDAPRAEIALASVAGGRQVPLAKPSLVLIWKQHDSGLYGRRVDQIARAYKATYPDHEVSIIEILQTKTLDEYRKKASIYYSDKNLILELAKRKSTGFYNDERIFLYQVTFNEPEDLESRIQDVLIRLNSFPHNSIIVIFPIVPFLENFLEILRPYRTILDVVDNQLSWSMPENRETFLLQYHTLARICDLVIFNSHANMDFFRRSGIFEETGSEIVIHNWYHLPSNGEISVRKRSAVGSRRSIVYTGNMRDRINWDLIARVADTFDGAFIHLIGAAETRYDNLEEVLRRPNVLFHGPKSELETLDILREMDIAIMPHTSDHVSDFMNPLKVLMYGAIGLPLVATNVSGIEKGPLVQIVENEQEFLDAIRKILAGEPVDVTLGKTSAQAVEYISKINELRNN